MRPDGTKRSPLASFSRIGMLLATACILFYATGCSETDDEQATEPQADSLDAGADLRQLADSLDAGGELWQLVDSLDVGGDLRQLIATLQDSLSEQQSRIRWLEDQLRLQKKLQPLLMDDRVGLWEPDENAMHIHFGDSVPAADVSDLVAAFNERYAGDFNPELQLDAVDGAVARVGVDDDAQLGERMGSTGSVMYMATMTYTLTSLPKIDSVYLDIETGSHASRGYLSRANWVQWVNEE